MSSAADRRPHIIASFLAVAAMVVAISGQSFWIDEANAAWKAVQPSLGDWWQTLQSEGGSDAQMPLYMLALWAWQKVVGAQEWALRALNLVWVLPGLALFAGRQPARWLTVAVSGFAWYCLDEARPYAMQLGASLILFGAMERAWQSLAQSSTPSPAVAWWMAAGILLLAGSSLLGLVWTAAPLALLALAGWNLRSRLAWRTWWPPILITFALLTALTLYYLWTLTRGARASAVGGTELKNLAFIGYELLGFSGLGPGRTQLRRDGLAALRPHLPALAAYGLVLMVVVMLGIRDLGKNPQRRALVVVGLALGGVAGLLVAVGVVTHFRVLGRHFTPLLPVLLALMSVGVSALRQKPWGRWVAVLFLLVSLASAASLRFSPRHAKDDYRGAAAIAKAALEKGAVVWWNADATSARFYGVSISEDAAPAGTAWLVLNPAATRCAQLPRPEVILASKRDLYDNGGHVEAYVRAGNYRATQSLMAFTVWEPTRP
jgi:hypothetical protein